MLCGKGGLHQNIFNNPLNEYKVFEEIVFIAIKTELRKCQLMCSFRIGIS